METSFTQMTSRGCDADVTGGTQLVRCVMYTGLHCLKYNVFDCFQYANTEQGGIEDLIMCGDIV